MPFKRLIYSICFAAVALLSSYAHAATFYIACYYNDTNESSSSKNPELMWPSKAYPGASSNYYWALDYNLSSYITLTGKIEDGFFVEQKLTLEEVITHCNNAIKKGTSYWPSNKSYILYDFKASRSDYDDYEYPIQFTSDKHNKLKINKIVLFGDSLSETGNLKNWLKIFPYYPYWYGRFSNGFIWSDFLTSITHIPVLNFAYGGAKTEGSNDSYWKDIANYITAEARNKITGDSKAYINEYLTTYLTQDSYATHSTAISDPENTLFVLWIGANDYEEKLTNADLAQKFFDHPDEVGGANEIGKRVVKNIVEQVNLLHSKGAYHFLILGLPDAGETPLPLTIPYKTQTDPALNIEDISEKLTAISIKNRADFKVALQNLQKELGNNINITYMDVGEYFNAFLQKRDFINGSAYDYGSTFLNTEYKIPNSSGRYIQNACYKATYYDAAFKTTYAEVYNFAFENTCKNAENKLDQFAIFWDTAHPTSYTHCWLADMVQNQMYKAGLISTAPVERDAYKTYCQKKVTEKNLWN